MRSLLYRVLVCDTASVGTYAIKKDESMRCCASLFWWGMTSDWLQYPYSVLMG